MPPLSASGPLNGFNAPYTPASHSQDSARRASLNPARWMRTMPLAVEDRRVVSFYMAAANKAVLNAAPDIPLLFLLIQLVWAVVLLHVAARFTPKVEIPALELKTAKQLAPVTFVNAVGLIFNILCLRGVDASFFQIARGLVLPFTITVSSIHGRSIPSLQVLLAAFIVTFGFFIGVTPDTQVIQNLVNTPAGQPYSMESSHPSSSRSTRSDQVFAPLCQQFNHPAGILAESWLRSHPPSICPSPRRAVDTVAADASPDWNASVFVWGSTVTGVFGFLLCVAGLLSIKVTSPITHMFSSAARSAIQTLLGVWIFDDILTTHRVGSILIIAAGTVYYTWTKSIEAAMAAPPKHMPLPTDDVEANAGGLTSLTEENEEAYDMQEKTRSQTD
ncbi:uncharacterized protein BXZ73DRAFT_73791 [Epithele typhae]|uniref:uncharacterized protein n=1 Tax=Epithele typhae TaxID=378194 RepID=UPI0020075F75|nr:uncharacterized protein BXZ73DRAFT_73791 [Epithele typhae]KAH9944222.1 hypothetical protein BXZ73DRAFT_73791 [Epithele typhae]